MNLVILTFTIIGVSLGTSPPKEVTVRQEYQTMEECHTAQTALKKSTEELSTKINTSCDYKQ